MKTAGTLSQRLDSLIASCVEHRIVKNAAEAEEIMYNALKEHRAEVLKSKPVQGQLTLLTDTN